MSDFDLSGKTALVTGGSKGIGFAIAQAMAEAGADIVLSSGGIKQNYVATCNPSEGNWYSKFLNGCSVRIGDITKQD